MKVNPASLVVRFRTRAQAPTQPLLWLTVGLLFGVTLTLSLTCWLDNRQSVALSGVSSAPASSVAQERDDLFLKTYRVHLQNVLGDQNPRQWLENQGISFPVTASAVYNASSSQLIVSNSLDNLQLVDLLIESLNTKQEHEMLQVFLQTRLVEMSRSSYEEESEAEPLPQIANTAPILRGVFTDPQFQVLWRKITTDKKLSHQAPEPVIIRSGATYALPLDSPHYTISPVIGADHFTLDLNLENASQHGNPATMVTIWKGQTVYIAYPTEDPEKVGLLFITANIVDPSGQELGAELTPDA